VETAIVSGDWSDRWLGLMMTAFAAAVLLVVRGLVAEETSPLFAALITAAAATLAVSRYVGLAEGPLIAFGASSVLFLRRALQSDDAVAWRHGAVMLALAANVKNEGIALAVSVAISASLNRRRGWSGFGRMLAIGISVVVARVSLRCGINAASPRPRPWARSGRTVTTARPLVQAER